MADSKTAKIFMHGRSQAVRLPKEFRLPGKEVRVRKVGNAVLLEPIEKKFDAEAWLTRVQALTARLRRERRKTDVVRDIKKFVEDTVRDMKKNNPNAEADAEWQRKILDDAETKDSEALAEMEGPK